MFTVNAIIGIFRMTDAPEQLSMRWRGSLAAFCCHLARGFFIFQFFFPLFFWGGAWIFNI
jgi:hypothetical protein